jgi:hypothetical protein
VPTTKVEYTAPGRNKSASYTLPKCGNSFDEATSAMIELVDEITR